MGCGTYKTVEIKDRDINQMDMKTWGKETLYEKKMKAYISRIGFLDVF